MWKILSKEIHSLKFLNPVSLPLSTGLPWFLLFLYLLLLGLFIKTSKNLNELQRASSSGSLIQSGRNAASPLNKSETERKRLKEIYGPTLENYEQPYSRNKGGDDE